MIPSKSPVGENDWAEARSELKNETGKDEPFDSRQEGAGQDYLPRRSTEVHHLVSPDVEDDRDLTSCELASEAEWVA